MKPIVVLAFVAASIGTAFAAQPAYIKPTTLAAEEALDRAACLKEISTPPIAMDAMIEPGAGRAEEARNA